MSRPSSWLLLGLLARRGKSCKGFREQSSSGNTPVFCHPKEVSSRFHIKNARHGNDRQFGTGWPPPGTASCHSHRRDLGAQPWRKMQERQQWSDGFLQDLAPSALRTVTARSHDLRHRAAQFHVHADLEVIDTFMQTAAALGETYVRQEGDDPTMTTFGPHPISRASPMGSWRWGPSARERAHLAVVAGSGFVTNMMPPVALAAGGEAGIQ